MLKKLLQILFAAIGSGPNVKQPREYITLDQYLGVFGRSPSHRKELTDGHIENAKRTLKAVNALLEQVVPQLPGFKVIMTSGWRPLLYNAQIGGARKSRHIICQAIDLYDPTGTLKQYLVAHQDALRALNLAIEDPRYTPDWCHIQTPPPPSGRTVFIPYPGPPPCGKA